MVSSKGLGNGLEIEVWVIPGYDAPTAEPFILVVRALAVNLLVSVAGLAGNVSDDDRNCPA